MSKKILEDWEDYDNKKLKGTDRDFFSCEEAWERNYLIVKIKASYPSIHEVFIRNAIELACMAIKAPRPRHIFVKYVAEQLKISLT